MWAVEVSCGVSTVKYAFRFIYWLRHLPAWMVGYMPLVELVHYAHAHDTTVLHMHMPSQHTVIITTSSSRTGLDHRCVLAPSSHRRPQPRHTALRRPEASICVQRHSLIAGTEKTSKQMVRPAHSARHRLSLALLASHFGGANHAASRCRKSVSDSVL